MPGPSSGHGSTEARLRGRARWLVTLGTLGFGGLLSLTAGSADAAAYAAKASLAPRLYYLNDTAGSPYTFTVTNTGSATNIGAVEIRRPNTLWKVSGCPVGPTGWLKTGSANGCTYRSASTSSDDIKPGQSRTFTVKATTVPGTMDHTGTWNVKVSNTNNFRAPSVLKSVPPTGPGLASTMYTFQLTRAVVSDSSRAPGSLCPSNNKTAIAASSKTIVVCGRNRASIALKPTATYSSLGGTFVGTPGAFLSGTIRAKSGNVVLADWNATLVTDVPGSGKTVLASIGQRSNRTSSLRLFKHYVATNTLPVAADDTYTTDEDTQLVVPVAGVLGNDTDAESNPLTAMNASDPPHGTVTLSPDGSFVYDPDPNYNGSDSFTYVANDGYGNSGPATVTITVDPVNDAPVSSDVAVSTDEDTPKAITLSATDVEGSTLTFVTGPAAHGTLSAVSGNSVTYTPEANFEGTDSFTYRANDGTDDSNTSTVTITVVAVNDAPFAVGNSYTTDEDTPLVVDAASGVLANDSDIEGSTLSATKVTDPEHGDVTLNADGSFTYTPDADFNGDDSFTYKANDGDADSDTVTVNIAVDAVNDAPVAQGQSVTTDEDTAKAITMVATDVDGDTLTYEIVTGPTQGSLGAVTGASVTYTPDADFNGDDSFTYKVNDGTDDSNTATVDITVDAVNDAPVANTDAYATDEDTALVVDAASGVLDNDSDVEGSTLTATKVTDPAHGDVTLNTDGSFTYTPDADFNGDDSFTYKANDGEADSNTATVDITVDAVNDPPVAQGQSVSTDEDTAKAITMVATDVDGDTLTYEIVTGPTQGSLGAVSGGSVTYTPDANYNGSDSFTYRTTDGLAFSNTATISITVDAVNDAPVANTDAYATDEDTALVVNAASGVLDNDSDVEGSTLTAAKVADPTHGDVTLNSDGSFNYTPDEHYNGPDSFTYTANDGDADSATGVVNITVDAVNDTPVAQGQSVSTDEDTAKAITMVATDADGDTLTYEIVTGPTQGSLGAVTGASVTYTPDANYNGSDSFTYRTTDGLAFSNTATISITVDAVNDAPTGVDDTFDTPEDTTLNEAAPGVLGNDDDVDGDTLTAVLVQAPSTGSGFALNADGSFTWSPPANANGPAVATFTYKVSDGTLESAVLTANIDVTAVNDVPTADGKSVTTPEDTAKAIQLSGDDAVEASDLTFAIVTGPTNGSLGAVTNVQCATGSCTADVTYTPDANYVGSDSFTYEVNDGTADSTAATVNITVTAVNDAPSFTKGADVGVVQDLGPYTISGWATAISKGPANESAQALTFTVTVDTVTPSDLFTTAPDVDETSGDLTFDTGAGKIGTATVSVTLSDNGGTTDGGDDESDAQTFTIDVVPPNAAPVAAATSATGNEDGGAITVNLSGTDEDGDALTFDVGTATNGLVTVPSGTSCDSNVPSTCTATVTYTPGADFFGSDAFTYTVNDGTVDSAAATASITVDAVNDEPSFTKGADVTVNEDSGPYTETDWATAISEGPANEAAQDVTFGVTTDNDALFSSLPAVSPSGELTFTPAVNASGAALVSVALEDDGGTTNGGDDTSPTQTFTVTVNGVNDAPSFTKGADQTLFEDAGAQSVSNWATAISKGPADESAQTVSFTSSNDNNALFSVQPGVTPTGTLEYTPAPDAVGSATVSLYISDTGGTANGGDDTSDLQTFTITVNGVNDQPSFTHDGNQTVLEDAVAQTVNGFVNTTSAGPADESAQTVTVAVTNVTNPTLFSVAPTITNGTLTYTPAPDANGSSTVTAVATDDGGTANGGDATGADETFVITVTAVNDAPSFTKGADQTPNEDAGAQSVSGWATAISQGPANESAQTVSFTVSNDNNGLFSSQPAVGPTGTLTYTSAANKYGVATVSVSISDNGGTANGGVDTSAVQTFTITVNAVNDAPVAVAKAFDVQTNMKISLSGLLTGATDPNDVAGDPSWTPTFTLGSITPGAGCIGCTISNVDNAAGTFDFEPPAGQTGTFTVTYTVVDNGHPSPGATSAAQTITFTVAGDVIWFVNASTGNDTTGTGTLTRPFQTLGKAATVDAANQRIFLHAGTYADGITLLSGEWLVGPGAKASSFDALFGITPPAGTFARPGVNGTNATVQGAVVLGSGNTLRGLNLTGATALTGSSFGTLTLGNDTDATTDVALNSAGQALSLAVGTVNGDFLSTSSSGGTNNVSLTTVSTTTTTSLGSGALSGATSSGFVVNDGTGTFSYSGTVTNGSASPAVSILNKDGGTVTFSGLVNDTAGAGVSLTTNTGTTMAFTGGVTLTSTTSPAFVATGGGTVTVTGAANTITSTTGTALNIANTTIGAADVTFRSISSNGAAKGIVLDTTGSVGNLVVTGNGGTCTIANTAGCSGGTIASSTGGDDSGTSPVGTGIVLNNTTAPSFTRMRINGSTNHGIRGNTVNGITLDSVVVDGTHGSNAGSPFNDGGVRFTGLTGTATFTALEVTGGHSDNVAIVNTSGTLNATFSSPRLGANSTTDGNDGLMVEGTGTATVNLTVQNGTFTASRGDQFQYVNNGSGGGSLTFTGNTLNNTHPAIATGGGGVTIQAGEKGPVTMNVATNTLTGAVGNAWTIVKSDDGTAGNPSGSITGTFNANIVGTAGVANSGSSEGSGLLVTHQGDGSNVWTITNNQIRQYNNYGIHVKSGDGLVRAGTNTANISGNTLANPGTNAAISNIFQGIHINSGVTPGDTFVTCANFGANSINGSGRNGGHDFRVQHRQSTTVRLPGYAGTQYDVTAAGNFVRAQITGSPTGAATSSSTGGGFSGAAC